MYKQAALILALVSAGDLYGENIFRSLLNMKPSQDLSKNNPGIIKQDIDGSQFFFYRLNNNGVEVAPPNIPEPIIIKEVIIKEVIREVEVPIDHPDEIPYEPVISNNPETEEKGHIAEVNEKDVLYGKDSPLRDDAVIDAWDRANEAKRRLEEHREYMERVRKARKEIESSKKSDITEKE